MLPDMTAKPALTDDEVFERLVAAAVALGREPGETLRGDTAIEAARKALMLLQLGLVRAMDRAAEDD